VVSISSRAPVPVGGFERLVAVPAQVAHDDVANRRLVVDDEDRVHARIVSSRT